MTCEACSTTTGIANILKTKRVPPLLATRVEIEIKILSFIANNKMLNNKIKFSTQKFSSLLRIIQHLLDYY